MNVDEKIKFMCKPSFEEIRKAEDIEKKKLAFETELHERDKWELAEEERKRKEDEEDKLDVESFFLQRLRAGKGKGCGKKHTTILRNIENGKRSLQHRNSFTSSSSIAKQLAQEKRRNTLHSAKVKKLMSTDNLAPKSDLKIKKTSL